MNTVLVGSAIIAIVEFIKEQAPEVNGGLTVLVAVVLGAGAGYLGLDGLNLTTGIMTGLSAVGIHVVAKTVGENN